MVSIDTGSLSVTGVERFVDTLLSTTRGFSFGDGNDQVTISDVGTTSDGQSQVTWIAGAVIEFRNPESGMTLSGGAGQDTLIVASVDSQFTSSLTISGEMTRTS